jgi:signal transduction histidine kinase
VKHYLSTAERELCRVSAIASQTLRFHRQSTHPRAVAPAEMLDATLALYQGRMLNCQVQLERRDRASVPITCFEGEIRQVLSNLVGNAIDALPPNGRLVVRTRNATDWRTGRRGVLFTVADSGSGMTRSTIDRIFEPFFTTKGPSGTGLGLWISREIVDRHQGHVKVRSSHSRGPSGTTFQLFLPAEVA